MLFYMPLEMNGSRYCLNRWSLCSSDFNPYNIHVYYTGMQIRNTVTGLLLLSSC